MAFRSIYNRFNTLVGQTEINSTTTFSKVTFRVDYASEWIGIK